MQKQCTRKHGWLNHLSGDTWLDARKFLVALGIPQLVQGHIKYLVRKTLNILAGGWFSIRFILAVILFCYCSNFSYYNHITQFRANITTLVGIDLSCKNWMVGALCLLKWDFLGKLYVGKNVDPPLPVEDLCVGVLWKDCEQSPPEEFGATSISCKQCHLSQN